MSLTVCGADVAVGERCGEHTTKPEPLPAPDPHGAPFGPWCQGCRLLVTPIVTRVKINGGFLFWCRDCEPTIQDIDRSGEWIDR